jgi:phenylalanyl-tRNA synthetase beta chain
LSEYCDPGLPAAELAERLAMTGTEVERVTAGAPPEAGPVPEEVREEPVLELEVTPNRVDCFGVYGVAREVHAISASPLAAAPWEEDAPAEGEGEATDFASVAVEAPDHCPRFTARVFTDVQIGPSPFWLQARLATAGQRPINNVVDITNYAMLLTTQPLHAFDLDKVPGGALTVRAAGEGEKMTTLDDVERVLDAETVLVCDDNGPSGIAGIMGGQVSEVSDATTRVLLEVANWNGTNILRTSRMLGLRSEASSRFEKQLHPELCVRAQRIASRLMVELCGAKLVPGTIDVAAETPEPHRIVLRGSRVEGLLGMPIERDDQVSYLERLGFGVEVEGEDLAVTVPPDRHYDVTREVDLIEEVARVHGLDEHLPATLPATAGQAGGLSREQKLRRRAEDTMRDLGFDEIVGWSFTDPEETSRLRIPADDPRAGAIALDNPLSEDQSVMRTTLLGSLLDVAQRNQAHGAPAVALYESARIYRKDGRRDENVDIADGIGPSAGIFAGEREAPVHEAHHLAALAVGPLVAKSWRGGGEPADFFALKGVLEALAGQLGIALEFVAEPEPFLHPGHSARVLIGGEPAGWIGEVHPLVCREWDLDAATAFEVELAALVDAATAGEEEFEDVTTFPAVYQDLAVVVPDDVIAAAVRAAVLAGGGELLRSAEIFDLYEGEQLEAGHKSLALRLEFRAPDRTLTDEEVARSRAAIEAELKKIGGTLRA